MKPQTLVFLIAAIVVTFLLQGANLINHIHDVNKALQSDNGFTKGNINLLCYELQQFEYFLYLFAALVGAVACSLFPIKKQNKTSKKELISNLQKIKKRATIEKRMI